MQPIQGPTSKVILLFHEPENVLYWTFEGTAKELQLFAREVIQYNKWIDEYLLEGLAPLSSYHPQEQDDPDQIMFAQSRDYQEIFGRPGGRVYYELRENGGISFDLLYVDDPTKRLDGDDDPFREDWSGGLLEEYHSRRLPLEPVSTLRDIIVQPLSLSAEFGLGYRLLPITQRLIERHQ